MKDWEESSRPHAADEEALDPEEARFFAEGERVHEPDDGSLAPAAFNATELEDEDHPAPRPVSPELLARRAKLRRAVAVGLFIGGTLLSGAIVVVRAAPGWTGARRATPMLLVQPAPTGTGNRAPILVAPALRVPEPVVLVVGAEPEPSVVDPAPSAADPAPSAAEPSLARTLTRKARLALESGHTREGVTQARAAIEADPNDAEPYILLAAGLEDLGQWAEAHRVFVSCAHRSSSTTSSECAYFARSSH